MVNVTELVDNENGTQKKRIFWDQEIYEQEQDNIFARCWLFLTHENQIPEPGDFFTTWMGEDSVVVIRQQDNSIKAFLNYCTHRGNQVCYADSGNTNGFSCSYHGWFFTGDGSLAAVPLETEVYYEELDRAEHGLVEVAQVDSYHGFVFGCFDAEAPSLPDYLGEMGWYMDSFLVGSGGAELIGPPLKSILRCNWKIPTENFIGDGYHIPWTHISSLMTVGDAGGVFADTENLSDVGYQVTTRHGHGFSVAIGAGSLLHTNPEPYTQYLQEQRPRVIETLGKVRGERFYGGHWNASIFPNCSFLYGTNTFQVWLPRGPQEIAVWTWVLVEKAMSPELRKQVEHEATKTFGTAGMFESDDGGNMEACTQSNQGHRARQGKMASNMGIRHEYRDPEMPGIIAKGAIGETSQRGYYRFWSEMMAANSWSVVIDQNQAWDSLCGETK